MSTTSDERREVAARLRDYAQLRNCYPFEAFYVRLNIALFEDNGWDRTDGYVFDYLADLIDPVCHVVTTGESRGKPIGSACSVCHAPLYPSTAWAHGMRYCAQCGHRVVDDD